MDLPTALLRDLLDLSSGVEGDADLGTRLKALASAISAAVSSYCGLDLTVHDLVHPVRLTSFLPAAEDHGIATSLRLPLAALTSRFDSQSRVIFYASTPGAFVDLAADLAHVLQSPTLLPKRGQDLTAPSAEGEDHSSGRIGRGRLHGDGQRGADGVPIVLDADLPPQTVVSRISGMHEMSTINRAVGMLIEQGHHPDDAHSVLRLHAAAAGVDTHIYAARLLRR